MITPSFSPTATERVLPKLALDFTTASLDSRVTFTRALNTATVVNSSGYVTAINADLPRFDYNPVSKVCNGLLIEESRTNTATYTEDFYNAAWVKQQASVVQDATTSPANVVNADKIVEDTSNDQHVIGQPRTVIGAYAFSCFVKSNGRNVTLVAYNGTDGERGRVFFNLSNGTITSGTGVIQDFGNGWYRCTIYATNTVTDNVYIGTVQGTSTRIYTGDGVSGVYVWGAQVEAGAFATSYIPNLATGTTTRNADVATMTGTNFSSWFNASEGTFQCIYDSVLPLGSGSSVACIMQADNNVDDNDAICLIVRQSSSDAILRVKVAGANQAAIGSSVSTNTKTDIVGAYKASSFAASIGASSPATDISGSVPTGETVLRLGTQTAGQYLNGHLYKLNYWPQRLINNEVQAFSKG